MRDAVPNSQHEVRVAGQVVANLFVGADGRGIVDLSNRMNDPRELAMPANFPEVAAGTRVDVGVILTGMLQLQPNSLASSMGSSAVGFFQNPLPFSQNALGLTAG